VLASFVPHVLLGFTCVTRIYPERINIATYDCVFKTLLGHCMGVPCSNTKQAFAKALTVGGKHRNKGLSHDCLENLWEWGVGKANPAEVIEGAEFSSHAC
jgi:hypothetical protein